MPRPRLYDYVIDETIELWRFNYGGKSLLWGVNPNRQSESKGLGRGAGKRHPPPPGGISNSLGNSLLVEKKAQERTAVPLAGLGLRWNH